MEIKNRWTGKLIMEWSFGVSLQDANLQGANLDFSCWPLWCGSIGVKVDARIAVQLAYHFMAVVCDDPEVVAAQESLATLCKRFHRLEECEEKRIAAQRGRAK
jgi:hypothetical protein